MPRQQGLFYFRPAILAGEGTIRVEHLPPLFQQAGGAAGALASGAARGSSMALAPSSAAGGGELRIPVGYTIDYAERALIELTLEHTKNNKTRAAEILGISLKTLHNKLKEYGARDVGI